METTITPFLLRFDPSCLGSEVDPEHHRQSRFAVYFRHPQIQVQTVLARAVIPKHHVAKNIRLHATRPKLDSFSHPFPRGHWLRWFPAQRTNWRRRKRNSLETADFPIGTNTAFQHSVRRTLLHVSNLRSTSL